jgi:hypothetical protein
MLHLMKILEVQHIKDGKVIWENKNILNTFHLEGEEFILSALFRTVSSVSIPSFYYIGMDNRTSPSPTDNMVGISTEPSGNGYSRQPVSSATGFTIENYTLNSAQHWQARSQVISFTGSGGSWGPVSSVFLTDKLDTSGFLISTAPLGTTRTIGNGEVLSFRFILNLFDQGITP